MVQKNMCIVLPLIILLFGFAAGQQCGSRVDLNAYQTKVLQSPSYPAYTGSSCYVTITGPSFYTISAKCYFNLRSGSCFKYTTDGTQNVDGSNAQSVCSYNSQYTFTSTFNSLTFGVNGPGMYSCEFSSVPASYCDCGWGVNTRILGGTEPYTNAFGSMAALFSTSTNYVFCGATPITTKVLLSAAHCFEGAQFSNPATIFARLGRRNAFTSPNQDTYYSSDYPVNSIVSHEAYNPDTYANDIALVITYNHMAWSRGVSPICLPKNSDTNTQYVGQSVTIAGWGLTSFDGAQSNVLLAAQLQVTPYSYCVQQNPGETIVDNQQICTTGLGQKDACSRDSGAPLMYYDQNMLRYFGIGVMSFGPPCGVNKPAVSTRTSFYKSWIKSRIDSKIAEQFICQY